MKTTENKPVTAPSRDDWFEEVPPPSFTDESFVEHDAVFGDAHLCVTAPEFRGAMLRAMVAGITLDLRGTRLVPEGATIELDAALSGVEILVPAEWNVITDVASVCAQVEADPARRAEPHPGPELHVVGTVAAGALYVRVTRARAAAA